MSLSTTIPDKKENLMKLREFHKSELDKIGVSETLLIGKLAYRPVGKTDIYVSFFQSELSKGQDIYLEFANRDNVPEDTFRTLYLWKFNPHFAEEYEMTEPVLTNTTRFLVPVCELHVIAKYDPTVIIENTEQVIKQQTEKASKKDIEIIEDYDLPNPLTDPPLNEMTIRDLAAIMLQKPCSNKEWLNKLITNK